MEKRHIPKIHMLSPQKKLTLKFLSHGRQKKKNKHCAYCTVHYLLLILSQVKSYHTKKSGKKESKCVLEKGMLTKNTG